MRIDYWAHVCPMRRFDAAAIVLIVSQQADLTAIRRRRAIRGAL
jgi:hypothetical protein